MELRLALIQMQAEKAAFEQNLARTARYLHAAAQRRVDIVAFPEMSLTGYADPTRYPQAALALDGPEVQRFLATTRLFPGTVLAGIIEANPQGKPFITQMAARSGALLGLYRKITIVDEEAEWFSPGDQVPLFHHGDLPFSLAVCADISNRAVFTAGSRQGARLIFELAAPGLYGAMQTRNWQSGYAWWETECRTYLSLYAQSFNAWIAVATQAGRTRDEDFPGGGYLFDPTGERRCATPGWAPGALYLEINMESGRVIPLP